jgi:hypothetical protein
VSASADKCSFSRAITFKLHLFTSSVPSQEVLLTRRGALMLMGRSQLCTENYEEVDFRGVSFAEVTNYLPKGTITLVCAADTSEIEPLIIPGVRVRSISRKIKF